MIFELHDYVLQEVKKRAQLVTEDSEDMGDSPVITFSAEKIDTIAKSITKVGSGLIENLVTEAMPAE